MGNPNRARNPFSTAGGFSRAHQIGALTLIAVTFFLTRAFDNLRLSCPYNSSSSSSISDPLFDRGSGRLLNWPQRGFGSDLDLKIYVYDESEIRGLRELMRGRDGKIPADACVKGQWGTQVKIHQLLLRSKFRTKKKEDADLFFVPSYVKCIRMMGGLNDKEINQTYVKGDRTDKRDISSFNTWKDIIIPGNVDDGVTAVYGSTIVQPLPLSKRKYLANFLGRGQGKVGRLQLVELAKQYPEKLKCESFLRPL